MTICRKCGTSNKDNQKFCTFCHQLLIADPAELAKIEAARQKKRQKAEKRLVRKHKRWKRAPLLLIPIGILNLINLLICADVLAFGFVESLGKTIGGALNGTLLKDLKYSVFNLFIVDITAQDQAVIVLRTLIVLVALISILVAFVLSIIMIVRMCKWHKYNKKLAAKIAAEKAAEAAALAEKMRDAEMVLDPSMRGKAVSYEALRKIAGHRDEYVLPEPAREMDIKTMYEGIQPQLWEYDDDSVRRILAAMASSRMLLCSAGAIDGAGLFDSLARTFSIKTEQMVCTNPQSISDMLLTRENQEGVCMHSAFAQALYAARISPNNLCFVGIKGADAKELSTALAPMQPYAKLPARGVALYLGKPVDEKKEVLPEGVSFGKMLVSENVWVLSILPEENRASCMEGEFGQNCATIYLRNSRNIFPPENSDDKQFTLPSVKALENAVASAEQEYHVSEDLWKVLDQLEEKMFEACGVRFSNFTIRAMERYTSVYMACGGKRHEAFDNGFAAIILTGYAEQIKVLCAKEDGETLTALLERTVGRDRLPVTMEALTSMGLN